MTWKNPACIYFWRAWKQLLKLKSCGFNVCGKLLHVKKIQIHDLRILSKPVIWLELLYAEACQEHLRKANVETEKKKKKIKKKEKKLHCETCFTNKQMK